MIEPYEGGSIINVYGVDLYIPPPPPVDEIKGSHLPERDQKWYRTELPKIRVRDIEIFSGERYKYSDVIDWESARREEIIAQEGVDPWTLDRKGNPTIIPDIDPDPTFYFEPLNNFRKSELEKCNPYDISASAGEWCMIKGEPVFINPFQRFYINWWKLDSGYPEWRWTDAKRFYYWSGCFHHPHVLGMTEVSKRGDGKSFRAGSVTYQVTIYTKRCRSGIQSKTEPDAGETYVQKIVEPYKDLPDFFIPINDNPSNPITKMNFNAPSRRGKFAASVHRIKQRLSLRSSMDYRSSGENVYDGVTINGILLRDEEGKTIEADVSVRHGVTIDCVYRDGRKRGNIYSTTTIEQMVKGGKNYQPLFQSSHPTEDLDSNGAPSSLIRRIFLPAYETHYSDEYGYPDIERSKREQSARRKQLEGDPTALLQYKLQYPWDEKELFSAAGLNCQYNIEVLRQRERIIEEFPEYRTGNFRFENGYPEPGAKVFWENDKVNGRWNVSFFFKDYEKEANKVKVVRRGYDAQRKQQIYTFEPKNSALFCGGFDPTKTHSNPDKRRSKAGGVIVAKENFWYPDEFPNFVAEYVWQPEDPDEAILDFLAGCWYYGCSFLPENNLGISYAIKYHGCLDFILVRPEKSYPNEQQKRRADELGIPAGTVGNDLLLKNKKTWMAKYAHRINLPIICNNSIDFDPQYRTLYDVEVASQCALMGATHDSNPSFGRAKADMKELFGFSTQSTLN